MEADVVFVDVGPGTGYNSLDFFLLGDLQVAVTTADPTSVVDVYRFIKLSAIRKALFPFLQQDLVTKNIATQEFASIDHVLKAVEQIDQEGRKLVDRAIAGFKPCLILNRMSDNVKINTNILRSLLKEYTGKDLNILGSIPEDEAVEQSVRAFMPVVVNAPNSPAATSLEKAARSLQLLIRMLPE
jgi:flagellar biosynthesis protein FlhG